MRKTTVEEIIALCNLKNINYVSSGEPFNDSHNKKQTYVQFTCTEHIRYGIQEISLDKLKTAKRPCKYCNHSMLKDTFEFELYNINPNIELLSKYVNSNIKIKCRCKIDGNIWEAAPLGLLAGYGCKICGYKKIWDSRGRKTTKDIIKEMVTVNPNIEIVGEYKGSHELIKCKCKIDGCEWESYVCNLLNQSAGCPQCHVRKINEEQALSIDEINKRISHYGITSIVLDGYTNNKSTVKCLCTEHQRIYYANIKTLLYNRTSGCPQCSQSNGERSMVNILEQFGLNIIQQYTFDDCRNVQKLRFDAYDIEHKIAFEYQGQQHYYPVDFSEAGIEYAQQEYDLGVMRDKIKKEYCRNNDILLIEIPYWEYDNMYEYLKNKLSDIIYTN